MTDVIENRQAVKWTRKELLGRVLWSAVAILFRYSPRQFWAWRRFLLRSFGAKIGKQVHIYPTVKISIPWNISIEDYTAVGDNVILYALGDITIGASATISQNAHLCAGSHDYRDPAMPLTKPPITVKKGAWICADTFIAPNITIEEGAVIGARAVVVKNVPAKTIVAGNPAKKIGVR